MNLISFAPNEDEAMAAPAFEMQRKIVGPGRAGSSWARAFSTDTNASNQPPHHRQKCTKPDANP